MPFPFASPPVDLTDTVNVAVVLGATYTFTIPVEVVSSFLAVKVLNNNIEIAGDSYTSSTDDLAVTFIAPADGGDVIFGGLGDNLVNGGRDDDRMFGGSGNDKVEIASYGAIADADLRAMISDVDANAVVNLGQFGTVTVDGVSAADLTLENFIYLPNESFVIL